MRRIILASASEGRKELFRERFGDKFVCKPMDIAEEELYHLPVCEMVQSLALLKAEACAALHPEDAVFAFDTMVECGGKVLGKPADTAHARLMLNDLSQKEQSVWTGYTFICGNLKESGAEEAVLMLNLNAEEIEAYIAKHPVTKYAGAYAIQKSDTKARLLKGSFDTVIGACIDKAERFYKKIER